MMLRTEPDAERAARNQEAVRGLVAKHGLAGQVEDYAQALFDLAMLDVNPAWFATELAALNAPVEIPCENS